MPLPPRENYVLVNPPRKFDSQSQKKVSTRLQTNERPPPSQSSSDLDRIVIRTNPNWPTSGKSEHPSSRPRTNGHLPPSQSSDLDCIVVVSNPDWPTSGKSDQSSSPRKRPVSGSINDAFKDNHDDDDAKEAPPIQHHPPKRPKIKRDFVNLIVR